MIVWLQTADDIRQTSTVQEEQGTTAAFDRARIMRFTVLNQEYAISLIFTHNRLGIFSDLLHHKISYILSEIAPLTTGLLHPTTARTLRWPEGGDRPHGHGLCRRWHGQGKYAPQCALLVRIHRSVLLCVVCWAHRIAHLQARRRMDESKVLQPFSLSNTEVLWTGCIQMSIKRAFRRHVNGWQNL